MLKGQPDSGCWAAGAASLQRGSSCVHPDFPQGSAADFMLGWAFSFCYNRKFTLLCGAVFTCRRMARCRVWSLMRLCSLACWRHSAAAAQMQRQQPQAAMAMLQRQQAAAVQEVQQQQQVLDQHQATAAAAAAADVILMTLCARHWLRQSLCW
jgi:hypothetical protein